MSRGRGSHPSLLRFLVVLLIMCDTIRRILYGARPIDKMMLGIEFLILLFILCEFLWKVWDWWKARKVTREFERETAAKLAPIAPEEAEALRNLILSGIQPPDNISTTLSIKLHPIIAKDYNVGWRIDRDYKDYMKRWAKKPAPKK